MLQTQHTIDALPKVAVALAACNGLKYIAEQIDSILQQTEVAVTIYVSVDASSDGTEAWIDARSQVDNRIAVMPHGEAFGGAALNFFRILREVDFSKFDFVSFADQDDIWDSDKLIRHIQLARQHSADGISSNVMAFWPDGSERLLDKAQPQRDFDYLFESAGPGCTFLMTPWLVNKVCGQLFDEVSPAKGVALHDWLTYAICRAHGCKWIIDSKPSVRYRQHSNNVVGANVGLKAKWARLQKLRQGWYRSEVIKIAQVCNDITPNIEVNKLLVLLNSTNYFLQLRLLSYVPKARRSLADKSLLAISIIFGLF